MTPPKDHLMILAIMYLRPKIKSLFDPRQNITALFTAAFFYASGIGVLLVALPFVVTNLGGSDRELGFCIGINYAAYIIACILLGIILDNFNAKRSLQLSALIMALCALGIFATITLHTKESLPLNPISCLYAIFVITGMAPVLFWPTIMGWVSIGREGKGLSRRLGLYNLSWASALAISPFFGGQLIEFSLSFTLILAAALFFMAFLIICPIISASQGKPQETDGQIVQEYIHDPALPAFRWIARIALIAATITSALMRTQLALFLTENLGFEPSQYGYAITFLCMANILGLFLIGKIHTWHFRLTPFILAQIFLIIGLFMIINLPSIWAIYFAAAIIGIGGSFMYGSHQFYNVSGGKKRSGLMALHEILLSIGFVIGSVTAGLLAENFGRYSPYKFGCVCLIISIVIQLIIRIKAAGGLCPK